MKKFFTDLMARSNWAILDTETAGLSSDDEICQIGVLSPTGKILLDTLVKPTKSIPCGATAIHGITDQMVIAAPPFNQVYSELCRRTDGMDIVVYNANFDFRMISQSIIKSFGLRDIEDSDRISELSLAIGKQWYCAMEAYAEYWGVWNDFFRSYTWQKLGVACTQQEIPVNGAHSAIGDCRLTLSLIKKLGELS